MSSRRVGSTTWRTRAALAADVLIVVFLFAACVSAISGGVRFEIFDIGVSLRRPARPLAIAAALIAARQLLLSYRSAIKRVIEHAGNPLPFEEEALTPPHDRGGWQGLGTIALVTLLYAGLTVLATWPQAMDFYAVSDLGDPLFSIWRLNWVHHQLFRDPLNLFNANIFFPQPLTLTYSDSMIVPSFMNMPLLWLGFHRVIAYNLVLLSGFALSGLAMFLLVRALTGRFDAALVAGAIFAVYPYRLEHFSHLELQMTMWLPLALYFLHRTVAYGRWRDGLMTGTAYALQMLSSLYYGVFLAPYMAVVGATLWIARRFPIRPIGPLAVGATLAGALIAPVAAAYVANKPIMGDRDRATIDLYSAEGRDYLNAHPRSRVYRHLSHDAHVERELFPGLTPVVLSAIALAPPLSVARIAYALALVLSFDGSLGFHGWTFTLLHDHVPPFRGLRAPARFSIFVGMTLAILAGFGIARLLRLLSRWKASQLALAAIAIAAVAYETQPDMRLMSVWPEPPAVYEALKGGPPAVLAEFPMPETTVDPRAEFNYLYFSTFHWHTLVNGTSGFLPLSYHELLQKTTDFPSDHAMTYLRHVGVQYITVNGAFYSPEQYQSVISRVDARPDLELMSSVLWEGRDVRLYRLTPQSRASHPGDLTQ